MDVLGESGGRGKEAELRCSLLFLIRFVAASSIALCAWEAISSAYLRTVVPVVNWLLQLQQQPLHLEQRRDLLLYVYEPVVGGLRLQALDYDSVYLNLIAVAALFTATSGVSLGWRMRWIGCSWLFLWATHVFSFMVGGQVAINAYLATLTPVEASAAAATQLAAAFSAVDPAWIRVLELWNVWARYGLGLAVWYVAMRNRSPAVLWAPESQSAAAHQSLAELLAGHWTKGFRGILPRWNHRLSEPYP